MCKPMMATRRGLGSRLNQLLLLSKEKTKNIEHKMQGMSYNEWKTYNKNRITKIPVMPNLQKIEIQPIKKQPIPAV